MTRVADLLTGQAHGLGQTQPGLDAAFVAGRAVVVDDAADPAAADLDAGQLERIAASLREMLSW